MKYDKVNDSGVREDMETGSRRDTQIGKGRHDLLPFWVYKRDAQHLENGATKYGDGNWLLGQKSSRYLASLLRHALAYGDGDRSEDHLAAIRWNTAGIMTNEIFVERGIYPPEMHDLNDFITKEGFDSTIRPKVEADNEALREKEQEPTIQDDLIDTAMVHTGEGEDDQDPELIIRDCFTCCHLGVPDSEYPCDICCSDTNNSSIDYWHKADSEGADEEELFGLSEYPPCYGMCTPGLDTDGWAYCCDICPKVEECDGYTCDTCGFHEGCRQAVDYANVGDDGDVDVIAGISEDDSNIDNPPYGCCGCDHHHEKTWDEWPCSHCSRNKMCIDEVSSDLFDLVL